jgi:hypothetical protein
LRAHRNNQPPARPRPRPQPGHSHADAPIRTGLGCSAPRNSIPGRRPALVVAVA